MLLFMQECDLLGIKVKDPATFPMHITPYPLNLEWKREAYLMDAQQFTMVHFLPDAHCRPGALQFTSGMRACAKDTDQGQLLGSRHRLVF